METLYELHRTNEPFIADALYDAVVRKGWLGKRVVGFCYTITFNISSEEYVVEVSENSAIKNSNILTREFLDDITSLHFMDCLEIYYSVNQFDPYVKVLKGI